MCVIQIGKPQLKDMLAHGDLQGRHDAACGLQIGHQELSDIIAHTPSLEDGKAACGIQIGKSATTEEALTSKR